MGCCDRVGVAVYLDVVVLGEELCVDGAGDVEALAECTHGALDATHGLDVELLCREDEGRVTGVHTCVLDVLGDSVVDDASVLDDGVHLNLLRVLDELRQHHRVFAVHIRRLLQVVHQVRLVVRHVHRSPRQHIRRPHQHRVLHTLRKLLRLLHGARVNPLRLVDAQVVAQLAEFVPVLAHINALRAGTQNGHPGLGQRDHKVVRDLTSNGDDNLKCEVKHGVKKYHLWDAYKQ